MMTFLVLTLICSLPAALHCGPIVTHQNNELEWQRSERQAFWSPFAEVATLPFEAVGHIFTENESTEYGSDSEETVEENPHVTTVIIEAPKQPSARIANGHKQIVYEHKTTGGSGNPVYVKTVKVHRVSTRDASPASNVISKAIDGVKQGVDAVVGQLVDKTIGASTKILGKTADLASSTLSADGTNPLLTRSSAMTDGIVRQLARLPFVGSLINNAADVVKQSVGTAVGHTLTDRTTGTANQLLGLASNTSSANGEDQPLARSSILDPLQKALDGAAKGYAIGTAIGKAIGKAMDAKDEPGGLAGLAERMLSIESEEGHNMLARAVDAFVNGTAEESNQLMTRSARGLFRQTHNFKKRPIARLIKQLIKLVRLAKAGNTILKNIVDSLILVLKKEVAKQTPNQKKVEKDDKDDVNGGNEDKTTDEVKEENQEDTKDNTGKVEEKKKVAKKGHKSKTSSTKTAKKSEKKKEKVAKNNKNTEDNDDDEDAEEDNDVDEDAEDEDAEEDNEDDPEEEDNE